MIIERDLPRRTALQQLSNIYWNWKESGSIVQAVDKAFDVEAVTKEFFQEYKRVFEGVMGMVKGFGATDAEAEAKKLFVQTLFNRLMFIYFLSRKGWLKFNGDPDYLNAFCRAHQARVGANKNFYTDSLRLLFFAGLNNYRSQDLTSEPEARRLIGDVPFLNGGLFDRTKLDDRTNVVVPDQAIDQIFSQLFDRFNFTVMESSPLDVEVAVDPEMLGKVFEELVTGRHESGSYYTPRPVVAFMCREALKGYLETQSTGASAEAIAAFVEHKDTSGLTISTAPQIGAALARVTVVDPACGSGAYLLGMMQELVELMTALYSAQLSHEAKDLYNLKLRIIQRNLYGADIDQFAVNIAMLRLWLSLAIEYDGPIGDLKPLPNLDFKIVCGDSLLGPDPSPENYGTLFRHRIHQLAGQLAALKDRHMRATGQEKTNLTKDIEGMKAQLREALAESAAPEGVVDWRVEFADVFDQQWGFDVVIANPPYIRKEEIPTETKPFLRKNFGEAISGQSDLYCSFYARGVQLLRLSGVHVYVCSNAWLDASYGVPLQKFLLDTCHILTIYDSSVEKQFSTANINTVITTLKKGSIRDTDTTTFALLKAPFLRAFHDAAGVIETRLPQNDLRRHGTRAGVCEGDKWGGKYLRAPAIYKRIFGEMGSRFSRLGDLAAVSGYIHDNNTGGAWPAKKVLWSVKDASTIMTDTASPGVRRIGVNPSGNSTTYAPILFPRTFGTRHLIVWAQENLLGKEFYKINPYSPKHVETIVAQLNSTLGILQREILGIKGLGGGALKFAGSDVGLFEIISDLSLVGSTGSLHHFFKREMQDIDSELDNSDRRALDEVIFDHLGLSVAERQDVYGATFELVDARRAKSDHVMS
jgi:hypothetical protein